MLRKPHNVSSVRKHPARSRPHTALSLQLKTGVFAPEILFDLLAYGLIGAGVDLGCFAVIVYGFGTRGFPSSLPTRALTSRSISGNGDLGLDSNKSINGDPGSRLVFRARSATFITMILCLLWLAFEVMDLRRSFFRMDRPGSER